MPRPRAPWWMYLVTATFLAYFALLIYSRAWGPERVGMNLDYTDAGVFVRAVTPNSPGESAGLLQDVEWAKRWATRAGMSGAASRRRSRSLAPNTKTAEGLTARADVGGASVLRNTSAP